MMFDDRLRKRAVARAVNRYSRALREGMQAGRADGDTEEQTDNFRRACERSALRSEQVKQVAYSLSVTPAQILAYLNFGLHLDKLIRENSGETLRRRAEAALERRLAYGLRKEVLVAISTQVFNLEF